jgi:hypothetical protein
VADGVEHVEPARHHQAPDIVLDETCGLAEKPRAVLERAAEAAVFARERGQKLGDEITVAAFNVHAVEPRLAGKGCGLEKCFLEFFKLPVRNQRIIGRQVVLWVEYGTVVGDDGDGPAVLFAVPARMSDLEYQKRIMVRAKCRARRTSGFVDEFLKDVDSSLVDVKLSRIGAAVGGHGRGLEPDKARAALGITAVTSEAQCLRRAIWIRIKPFHGVHGKPVGQGLSANGHFPEHDAHVLGHRKRDAEFVHFPL